jgi:coenzyme F420-reducing hydrogenase delta subunit
VIQSALNFYVFYCSNSLDEGSLAKIHSGFGQASVKTISLPCSGKIDIPYLLKAFETGAHGVAIVTCKLSECRHLEGNMRAHKRADAVESILKEIGFGGGRMAVISVKNTEDGGEEVLSELKEFFNRIEKLPQSSVKNSAWESVNK